MPDYVGYVNENENPKLGIENVPEGIEPLVLVLDDPDVQPVVGFTFDHWLVWDIDPDVGTIPRGWEAKDKAATVGYYKPAQETVFWIKTLCFRERTPGKILRTKAFSFDQRNYLI